MPDQALGQKIRSFRERAKLSQFNLELELGMSPGSLSRIENNQVNPTKETILNISDFFKLNAVETAGLFGIDLQAKLLRKSGEYSSENMKKLFNELLTENVIEAVIADILNQIQQKMGYLGISFSVVDWDSETVQLKYFSDSFVAKFSKRFIFKSKTFAKQPLRKDLSKSKETILDGKYRVTDSLADFVVPPLTRYQAKLIQIISGIKSIIGLPVKDRKGKVVAIINLARSKPSAEITDNEVKVLQKYADYIGNVADKFIFEKIRKISNE